MFFYSKQASATCQKTQLPVFPTCASLHLERQKINKLFLSSSHPRHTHTLTHTHARTHTHTHTHTHTYTHTHTHTLWKIPSCLVWVIRPPLASNTVRQKDEILWLNSFGSPAHSHSRSWQDTEAVISTKPLEWRRSHSWNNTAVLARLNWSMQMYFKSKNYKVFVNWNWRCWSL